MSLPIKKVHPQGECNKAMSSKLKKYKVTDSDDMDVDDDSDEVDLDEETSNESRWESLKNINFEED